MTETLELCPQCGSQGPFFKAGFRTAHGSNIQRFACRHCGRRFSEKTYKQYETKNALVQICAAKAKNLDNQFQKEQPAGGTQNTTPDVKGRLVQYMVSMQNKGYAEATTRMNMKALKVLADRGARLLDVESVKSVIALQKSWSQNRRRNVINAYGLFLKTCGLSWEKPKCHCIRKFPFIPQEAELDALISGTGKKTATFLQTLKETAMRCGEAKRLEWTNIDFEKGLVTLNDPEKGSNPRIWKVDQKLMSMLNALARDSTKVFGDSSQNSMKTTFIRARKRLALKLANPRLTKISFHTFRHWKATMLYHETHDPYYVRDFLGHKELRNTEIYINIERTIFEPGNNGFTVRVVEKPEDMKALLEIGFEYVCQKDNLVFLRKRK